MDYPVPSAPFDNPQLSEGTYDAVIHSLSEGEYGDRQVYVKAIFEVPAVKKAVVTNFYFPHGLSTRKTAQRFWHFCRCIGKEPKDYFERPQDFAGQRLRIVVHQVKQPTVNWGRPYHDVKLFLPPEDDAGAVVAV